jgi:hypothetical protein
MLGFGSATIERRFQARLTPVAGSGASSTLSSGSRPF